MNKPNELLESFVGDYSELLPQLKPEDELSTTCWHCNCELKPNEVVLTAPMMGGYAVAHLIRDVCIARAVEAALQKQKDSYGR